MKLMPPKHPYFPKGCGNCPFGGSETLASGKQKNCSECKNRKKVMGDAPKNDEKSKAYWQNISSLRKETRKYFNANNGKIKLDSRQYFTSHLKCTHEDFKNVINHCKLTEEIEVAKHLNKYLPMLKDGKYEPLKIKDNTTKKINERYVRNYTVYEFEVNGDKYILKCEARKRQKDSHVTEFPYFLKKKK